MPQVTFTPAAIRDMQRLQDFLQPMSGDASRRAGEAIRRGVKILGVYPRIGRLIEGLPEQYREWLINFGDSGYVARYRIGDNEVAVLAVRHQKEDGFR